MSKILVLGIGGMAGHVIFERLRSSPEHEVIGTVNQTPNGNEGVRLDVTDLEELTRFLMEERPDLIVNCVGMLIKGSKEQPSKTILINAFLPHFIKELISAWGGKLIHISTDCVFSGLKGAYIETDQKDAMDLYGQSKALGEIVDNQHLTIRTSIIGPELKIAGEGLLHWFMAQSGDINGYTQAWWSGVTTLELSKFILHTINNSVTGLVHLTNNTKINKYDLLKLFSTVFTKGDVSISPYNNKVVDKSFVNTNSSLGYKVPSYQQMLEELKSFMLTHKDFYPHYTF